MTTWVHIEYICDINHFWLIRCMKSRKRPPIWRFYYYSLQHKLRRPLAARVLRPVTSNLDCSLSRPYQWIIRVRLPAFQTFAKLGTPYSEFSIDINHKSGCFQNYFVVTVAEHVRNSSSQFTFETRCSRPPSPPGSLGWQPFISPSHYLDTRSRPRKPFHAN